jgi:hypothetical protein
MPYNWVIIRTDYLCFFLAKVFLSCYNSSVTMGDSIKEEGLWMEAIGENR